MNHSVMWGKSVPTQVQAVSSSCVRVIGEVSELVQFQLGSWFKEDSVYKKILVVRRLCLSRDKIVDCAWGDCNQAYYII